jgi:hypothetical protein
MPRAFDSVFQMDRVKLLKLITSGLVLAVLGLAIMMATNTIISGAPSLFSAINNENTLNFYNNLYGYAEWAERNLQSTQSQNWLVAAMWLLKAVGQIALLFGLLIALIGLFGSAINPQTDDKMRLVCMITGCVLLFVMFFNFGVPL